jgi:hypothetical protein
MNFVSKLILILFLFLFLFLFFNVIVIFIFQSELLKVIIYFIFRHMTLSVSSNTIGSCIIRLGIAAIRTSTSQSVSKHICRYKNFVKFIQKFAIKSIDYRR